MKGHATAPAIRMVMVDPSPAIAHALQAAAADFNVDVVSCPVTNELFPELVRFQPHVAVVDARLCELGGIGVVRAARVLAPDCEVVLTSIDPASEIGLEAIRAGALECVMTDECVIRVRAHLARLRARLQRSAALPDRAGSRLSARLAAHAHVA